MNEPASTLPARPRRLSLRLTFNLILALVFLLSLAGSAWYYDRYLERQAIQEVRHNSQVLIETAQAIRNYTTDEVKPHLDPLNAERFLPQTVPAFAATETLRRLAQQFPGYAYKEAVLNPTNPRNLADEFERGIIGRFRAGGGSGELSGIEGEGVSRAVYVARPFTIKNPQCLACHGEPEAAPATMKAFYGAERGFGWKIGETVGIQVVRVPLLYPLQQARETFRRFLGSLVAIFAVTFAGLNAALSTLVIEPLRRANLRLEDLATKDFLTDLVNRRRFFERLEQEMAEARINRRPLSVVIFDLDFFKRINDTFGHDQGDAVLKHTAIRVRELLRSSDCAARFGGEEFILLLRETPVEVALAFAETVRARIAGAPFEQVGMVSASFGVAAWDGREEGHALIVRADKALYAAKQAGRNRVMAAEA